MEETSRNLLADSEFCVDLKKGAKFESEIFKSDFHPQERLGTKSLQHEKDPPWSPPYSPKQIRAQTNTANLFKSRFT